MRVLLFFQHERRGNFAKLGSDATAEVRRKVRIESGEKTL